MIFAYWMARYPRPPAPETTIHSPGVASENLIIYRW